MFIRADRQPPMSARHLCSSGYHGRSFAKTPSSELQPASLPWMLDRTVCGTQVIYKVMKPITTRPSACLHESSSFYQPGARYSRGTKKQCSLR
jgi:hypothetical protein